MIIKNLNYDQFSPALKQGARKTLINILESLLRIIHPIMPFITEEIWQQIPVGIRNDSDTVMLENYPEVDEGQIDQNAVDDVAWLKSKLEYSPQAKSGGLSGCCMRRGSFPLPSCIGE